MDAEINHKKEKLENSFLEFLGSRKIVMPFYFWRRYRGMKLD
jgi:hypothetical protein